MKVNNLVNIIENKLIESNLDDVYSNLDEIHLIFPFYALKVYAESPQYHGFEGFYTRDYVVQGEAYPGFASPTKGSSMLDTALNYVKQYKTEKIAQKAAHRLNEKYVMNRFEVTYIQSIEDFN